MSLHSAQGEAVLRRCEAAGLTVSVVRGEQLLVTPAAFLTDELRNELRQHKPALLKLLLPHVNGQGDLVIPFRCDPRFHYWRDGQSILDTLREIGAPDELVARHQWPDTSHLVEPMAAMRARWQALHDGTFAKDGKATKGKKRL